MHLFKQLPILAALVFASCHSMHGTGKSLSAMRTEVGSVEFSEFDLNAQSASQPMAQLPLRLGIVPPVSSSANWYDKTNLLEYGAWSDDEISVIDAWCQDARAEGIVAHYEFLPSLLVDPAASNVLEAVRGAARTRNLDAVLIARVGSTVESASTMLSILDLALVPAFVLPTGEFKATAIFEGAVLDTQSGYPYAVGSAESSYKKAAPSMIADVKSYQRKARLQALETMSERLFGSVDAGVREAVNRSAGRVQASREREHASQQYWIGDPVPKGGED